MDTGMKVVGVQVITVKVTIETTTVLTLIVMAGDEVTETSVFGSALIFKYKNNKLPLRAQDEPFFTPTVLCISGY